MEKRLVLCPIRVKKHNCLCLKVYLAIKMAIKVDVEMGQILPNFSQGIKLRVDTFPSILQMEKRR